MSTNPAHDRIWNDDAQLTEVQLPGNEVRLSDEALTILREQGVQAYEEYVNNHSN